MNSRDKICNDFQILPSAKNMATKQRGPSTLLQCEISQDS